MRISTPAATIIICVVIGLVWSLALSFHIIIGLLCGGLFGYGLSILLTYNTRKGETGWIIGVFLGLLIIIGIGGGLITWLIRGIFF